MVANSTAAGEVADFSAVGVVPNFTASGNMTCPFEGTLLHSRLTWPGGGGGQGGGRTTGETETE